MEYKKLNNEEIIIETKLFRFRKLSESESMPILIEMKNGLFSIYLKKEWIADFKKLISKIDQHFKIIYATEKLKKIFGIKN